MEMEQDWSLYTPLYSLLWSISCHSKPCTLILSHIKTQFTKFYQILLDPNAFFPKFSAWLGPIWPIILDLLSLLRFFYETFYNLLPHHNWSLLLPLLPPIRPSSSFLVHDSSTKKHFSPQLGERLLDENKSMGTKKGIEAYLWNSV